MPRTTVFGVYDHGTYGGASSASRSSPRAAAAPAAPAVLAHRRQARRARGRRDRAADRLRRQRPARRHAGRRGAHLSQPLRRAAGPRGRDLHRRRRRLARACATSPPPARGRRHRRSADGHRPGAPSPGRARRRARLRRRRGRAGERRRGAEEHHRFATLQAVPRRSAATSSPFRAAGIRRSISPRIWARGRPWTTRIHAFVPGSPLPDGLTVAGSAAGALHPRGCARGRGAPRGRGRGGDRPAPHRLRPPPKTDPESTAVAPVWRVASRGQGVRRFPERRDRRGRRARIAGGLSRGRASQALHHARHGDRPGQDLERRRPRHHGRAHRPDDPETGTTIFRPPYTPVAIGALAGHHRGQRLPADAPCAGARLVAGAGRRLRRNRRCGCARSTIRATGETDWLETVDREVRAVRRRRRRLRRLDARQDRHPGRGCGDFLDRVYCNGFVTLPVGKARYGLMLREDGFVMDDGTTARLGRDALSS